MELKNRLYYFLFKSLYKIHDFTENDKYGIMADKVATKLIKNVVGYDREGNDFTYWGENPQVNDYGFSNNSWNIEDGFFPAIYDAKDYNTMMFNLAALKFELEMINLYFGIKP